MNKVLPFLVMLSIIVICQGCLDNVDRTASTYFYLSDDFTIASVDGKYFQSTDGSLNYKIGRVEINDVDAEKKEVLTITHELESAIKTELTKMSIDTNTNYILGDAITKSGDVGYGEKLIIEFGIEIVETVSSRTIDGIYSFVIRFDNDSTPSLDEELTFYLCEVVTIAGIGDKSFISDSTYLNYTVEGVDLLGIGSDTISDQLEHLLRTMLDRKSIRANIDYTLGEPISSGSIATGESLVIKFDIDIRSLDSDKVISDTYSFTILFNDKVGSWSGYDKIEPDRDIADNYLIKVPANLAWLADQEEINTNVLFLNNIDMGGYPFTGIKRFSGIFDGNGKSISNINIDSGTSFDRSSGLIQSITGESVIKNLTLKGGTVRGGRYVGSFVGTVGVVDDIVRTIDINRDNFTIDNLTSDLALVLDDLDSASEYDVAIGGFVAMINDRTVTIRNSIYRGDILSSSNKESTIGGFIGKISNSDITMKKLTNYSNISVASDIEGINIIGGILGEYVITGMDSLIVYGSELVNNGDLSSNSNSEGIVGGIIGVNNSNDNSESTISIVSSVNTGKLSGDNILGGVIGFSRNAKLEVIDTHNSGLIEGIIDIDRLVILGSGGGIIGSNAGIEPVSILNVSNSGSVQGSFMYSGGIIGNNSSLGTTDIIGCSNTGNISGNMYTGGIIGENSIDLSMTLINSYNIGTISSSNSSYVYLGGLIGSNTASDTKLSGSYNRGNLTISEKINITPLEVFVGGLIGRSLKTTSIEKVYNSGDIDIVISPSAVSVGGIIGFGSALTVSESYNTGDIFSDNDINVQSTTSAENYVGGIVGSIVNSRTADRNYLVKISDSYNVGDIWSKGVAGGIIGNNYYEGSNSNRLEISHSFNYGTVTGGILSGMIIGSIYELITTAIYTDNYWYSLSVSESDNLQIGGARLDFDEFRIADNFEDWKVNIDGSKWEILEGINYPTLVNNKEIDTQIN